MSSYGTSDPNISSLPIVDQKETKSKKVYLTFIFGTIFVVCAFAISSFKGVRSTTNFESLYGDGDISKHLEMFNGFIETYKKSYETDDEKNYRFAIFRENLATIDSKNSNAQEKGKNTIYGINYFADMKHEEWRYNILMDRSEMEMPKGLPGEVSLDMENCISCKRFPEFSQYDYDNLPENFDWRDYGAVTAVKNQVYCGSCWTFGTTGDIEGTWFLAGNDLISLSEQQLVSCDTKYDFGCDGGWQEAAFENIITHGGIVSEDEYPYLTVNMLNIDESPICDQEIVKEENFVASISSWAYVSLSAETESQMALALVRQGPLTLAINADPMDFYESGIDDPDNCDPFDLNHAVLLVGYGVENGEKYWTIKNSWDFTWGEDGYYRIIRGENKCGLALEVSHSYASL